jgi:hypothetical protein
MLRLEEGVRSARGGIERFPAVPKAVGKPVFGDSKTGMSVSKISLEVAHLVDGDGCPGRDRTYDQVINSHLLCH